MLQYPLALSSSSVVAKDNSVYIRSNDPRLPQPAPITTRRMPKDGLVSRPSFPGAPPPSAVPLSISTNLSPSPTSSSPSTTSSKLPRSPYISSRQTSSPVSLPVSRPWSSKTPADTRPSSALSTSIEDVLFPGDVVGQGGLLMGEALRLVSIGSTPRPSDRPEYEEPAKEFEVVRRLGAGSYAVVYLVREVLYRPPPSDDGHMSTVGLMDMDDKFRPSTVYGREYAIKCLSKANLDEEALAAQMSEVTIHQSLHSHPNIVTLHRTLETSSFLLLLLEYVPGEDLFYFLEQARDHYETDSPNSADSSASSVSRTPPTPSLLSTMQPSQLLSRTRLRLISSMFAQMCDAVAACHLQQVYHRDIKPENFIVTDGWITTTDGRQERKVIVKLTDFGLSTTDVESSDMDCGSAPYMSYECRNNIAPTYRPRAADVWSLGIVLINMLYHYNPWTDTAQGACNSFDLFRQHPVNFFMQRFAGMTRPVAELFASRVFNVINESSDDSRRITASEFGSWAKDLPDLLGDQPSPSFTHKRVLSVSSTHGYPIALSTPASHRPSSRQASNSATAMRSQSRSASRAPSIGPSFQRPDLSELSTVIDQGDLEEQDEPEENDTQDVYVEGMTSRSTSTNKRRKRGARKGKGGLASPTHQDETLATLAVASQSLAREISKASKVSSHHSVRSISTKASTTESARARRQLPYEPVSMYPIPTALYSRSSSHSAATSPAPTLASQPSFASIPSFSAPVPVAATAAPVVTKKPSKWKLSFSKATSTALTSPSEELSSPPLPEITPSQQQHAMSATASNVTSLIMGLSAPTVHSAPVTMPPLPPIPDDAASTWTRGRRSRGPSPHGGKSRSRGPPSQHAPSPSPHPSADRWPVEADRRSDRAVSPNSTRSGRPVASCGSSMVSGNWRSSTSTTSSAGTSTSAFTHYSNSSLRSVSTAATSVSATSWRTNGSKPPLSSPKHAAYPHIPKNVKIMDGVPWELMELPRQQHPNPVGDIFGQPPVRKQRTRKPKELTLDTITERPQNSAAKGSPGTRQRRDASTSTTDLRGVLSHESTKDDGDNSPKKVQKGQINALAKMLSALRR